MRPVASAALAVGALALLAGLGWVLVISSEEGSAWRGLEGPLAFVSIGASFVAVALAVVAGIGSAEKRRALTGLALGIVTLAFWLWAVISIIRTT